MFYHTTIFNGRTQTLTNNKRTMGNQNTIELLEKVKGMLTKLSKKTRVEVGGTTFEYSGELGVGTELELIEGEFSENLSLEDGTELVITDNTVVELNTPSVEEVEETTEEVELEAETEETEEVESVELETEETEETEDELLGLTTRVNELEEIITNLTQVNEELTVQVEKLAKEPAVKPKHETVKGSYNKTESRAAQILSRVNRNKK